MSWRSSLCLHRSTDLGSQLVHFSLTTKLQQLLLFLGRKGSRAAFRPRGSLLLFFSRFCFLAFLSLGDELEEDEDEDFFFERFFFFFFPFTASSTSMSSLSKRPCKPLRS